LHTAGISLLEKVMGVEG